MNELRILMDDFEKRNNISVIIELFSDGSWTIKEFYDEDEVGGGYSFDDLIEFLKTAQFKLADDGRCISPMIRIDKNELEGVVKERCHADRDGDCDWDNCPQIRDGEPNKSSRHCPLDVDTEN